LTPVPETLPPTLAEGVNPSESPTTASNHQSELNIVTGITRLERDSNSGVYIHEEARRMGWDGWDEGQGTRDRDTGDNRATEDARHSERAAEQSTCARPEWGRPAIINAGHLPGGK